MDESPQISLADRCKNSIEFMSRRTDVRQVKLYIRGKEREILRADISFVEGYSMKGINVRYLAGDKDEDFIVFERG